MAGEQKVRGLLFYLSLAIFFIGLPFILSFALGYKFNPHTLRFSKTGLIVIKTQPQGASVYLGGNLLNEQTPVDIRDLLPGKYQLMLELKNYYPWLSEVSVEEGKVVRLDKIILFPVRPDVKQLNKERLSAILLDNEADAIYYFDLMDDSIYKSNLEGENFKRVGTLTALKPPPYKYKLSVNREKLLYFNSHQIVIVYLESQEESLTKDQPALLDLPNRRIIDVFWHSDNYHLVLVTEKNIEVVEARPQAQPVSLVALNKRNTFSFYNPDNDELYFLDSQKAGDGKLYTNLYKLELRATNFPMRELVNPQAE